MFGKKIFKILSCAVVSSTILPIVSCENSEEKYNFFIYPNDINKIGYSQRAVFPNDPHAVFTFQTDGDFLDGDVIIVAIEQQTEKGIPVNDLTLDDDSRIILYDQETKTINVNIHYTRDLVRDIPIITFKLSFKVYRDQKVIFDKLSTDLFFVHGTATFDSMFDIETVADKKVLKGFINESWTIEQLSHCDILLIPWDIDIIDDNAFSKNKEIPVPDAIKFLYFGGPNNLNWNNPSKLIQIRSEAFWGCTNFQGNIHFPDSLKTINEKAFEYCTNIQGIYIPWMTDLKGAQHFNNCASLTSIDLSSFLTTPDSWQASGAFTKVAETGTVTVAQNTTKQWRRILLNQGLPFNNWTIKEI